MVNIWEVYEFTAGWVSMTWIKKGVSGKKGKIHECCGRNKENETGIVAWYNFSGKARITAPQLPVKTQNFHLILQNRALYRLWITKTTPEKRCCL